MISSRSTVYKLILFSLFLFIIITASCNGQSPVNTQDSHYVEIAKAKLAGNDQLANELVEDYQSREKYPYDCALALDVVERAIEEDPSQDTFFRLAEIHKYCSFQGDSSQAAVHKNWAVYTLQKGLELPVENIESYLPHLMALSELYLQLKEKEESQNALDQYQLLLEADYTLDNKAKTHYWGRLCDFYLLLEEYEKALNCLSNMIEYVEDEYTLARVEFRISNIYEHFEDWGNAILYAERSLAHSPRDVQPPIQEYITELENKLED